MIETRPCVIWALMTLVGCATVHSSMMKSAGNLGSSADVFVGDAGGDFPHAVPFASQAHRFIDTVDREGDRKVISAYERLWDSYSALRDEVERSGSPQSQADFKPVAQAFAAVVRDMHGYAGADSSVYARGGFQHDPYYDP